MIRYLIAVILAATLAAPAAFAQSSAERTVQTSTGRRLPVAIEEFTLGGGGATPQTVELMKNLAEIIRSDLAFSGYFRVVRFDSLYLKLMDVPKMSMLDWSRLGAEYLGQGTVTNASSGFRIVFSLNATTQDELILEKTFSGTWEQSRQVAHQIANEVIYYLWGGRTQIFQTKLILTRESERGKDLYISDYDGYDPYPLTNTGGINMSPCWFPSGDRIVFTSYRDNNPDLFLLFLKNNQVQKISSHDGLNTAPAVSPDGRYIIATLSIDGNAELYLLSGSGQVVRRLTNSPAIESEPTISPDGKYIAFTSDRLGLPQVFVMDFDGKNVRRITFQGSYNASPAWSPLGDKIAFVSRNNRGGFDLCTVRPDGTGYTTLTTEGTNESPDWSPDGYHIVYSSLRRGQRDIYTMTYDGSNERRVTTGGGFSNPAWGPFPR